MIGKPDASALLRRACGCVAASALMLAVAQPARAADTYLPQCFKPGGSAVVKLPAKPGPYRIAFANGFVGNSWRVQMVQTLNAYAAQPDVARRIKELHIVSVGTDVSAQIAAMDNFINAGYDAILLDSNSPTAFRPVLRRAKKAGVLIVTFDSVLDKPGADDPVIQVNEDQVEMGRMMGRWLDSTMKKKDRVLEVRGVSGNSVDRDRHDGFHQALAGDQGLRITEVVGNWDDGTAQKAVADALAVNGHFDGLYVQGGSTGAVRALLDAHEMIPVGGEAENGFRKQIAQYGKDGLLGDSAGQSPALAAVALKAALAALSGETMPQEVSVPIQEANYKTLKAGETYFPDISDTFFAASDFPPCDITLSAAQITGQAKPE
jgi:ribose transport system substrate-binding protein